MKISREWATPVTIGAFALMAVTGVLMFFHFDTRLNKVAHEWLGWAMLAGAAAHVAANWLAFRRYFVTSNFARGVVGAFVIVLAASFLPLGGASRGSPPVLAMHAVTAAPLSAIAPLSGRTADELIGELAKAGIVLADAQASLDSVVRGDHELEGKAMRTIFGGR